MMFFDFNKNTETELVNRIDIDDVMRLLVQKYGDSAVDDLDGAVSALIRNPKEFNKMRSALGLSRLELLTYCVKLSPDIFKYHLLKFIKENYNFERDS